jgi:hypothetical protein
MIIYNYVNHLQTKLEEDDLLDKYYKKDDDDEDVFDLKPKQAQHRQYLDNEVQSSMT